MQQPPGGYGPPGGGYGPPPGGGYGPPPGGGYGPPPGGGYGPPQGGFGGPPQGGFGAPPPGGFGAPPAPPPQKKGMSTAAIILIVLLVLMALGGGGCALCVCLGAKGVVDQKAAEDKEHENAKINSFKVPIAQLLKDYEDNEVRADGLYKGKYVEFTGKVSDVKKDVLDQMYVTIGTGKLFEIPLAQCYFDDKHKARAATLSKGNSITVRGRVEGLIFNVQVKDCEFL